MGAYGTQIEGIGHNMNDSTFTLGGTHKIEAIEKVSIKPIGGETTVFKVGDGTAQLVDDMSTDGEINIELSEMSPSNLWLWEKFNSRESFSFVHTNTAMPAYSSSAKQCRVKNTPTTEVGKDPAPVAWTLVTTYLVSKGGAYTLYSAE
jgi:hypothetical protein